MTWELKAGWLAGDEEILPALHSLFSYSENRATGWLYAARQIGMLAPAGWPDALSQIGPGLLSDIETATGFQFDAVCFQAYLDGAGVGWHHDRDWDAQAILSLGVTRSFGLRRNGEETFLSLNHGDLLIMPPGFQDEWEHCVPAEQVKGERCSLVFRAE